MTTTVFVLLIIFQIKHLIADYYLQFPYMYLNKGNPTGWFMPLFEHSFVHSVITFIIAYIYIWYIGSFNILIVFGVTLFDLLTHFVTDRWKATRGTTPNQEKFWTALGIDQMIHHIVSIIIVFVLTL